METVNCWFAWFLWSISVSQVLPQQLNELDWRKIQLAVWQNNHPDLRLLLPRLRSQLSVGCLFQMAYLIFLYLKLIAYAFLLAAGTTGDAASHGSGWCCPSAEHSACPCLALLGHVLMAPLFEGRRCCLPSIAVPKPTLGWWGQTSLIYCFESLPTAFFWSMILET